MTAQEYKVVENRLRRASERQGLRLEKSRVRDPRAVSYGTYQLVDMSTNAVAVSGSQGGYGLDLSDVANALLGTPIASLAAELDARGYSVSLGKSHGGELCKIQTDPEGHSLNVDVIDFGRDPLGRSVDIRWVSGSGSRPSDWHSCNALIDAHELADRVIATL